MPANSFPEVLALCAKIEHETKELVSQIEANTIAMTARLEQLNAQASVPVQWENNPESWLAKVQVEEAFPNS